jgi:hypothetical protein
LSGRVPEAMKQHRLGDDHRLPLGRFSPTCTNRHPKLANDRFVFTVVDDVSAAHLRQSEAPSGAIIRR